MARKAAASRRQARGSAKTRAATGGPRSRYPPSKLIFERDAVTLGDIKRVSATRAAYTLKRTGKGDSRSTILFVESGDERRAAHLDALSRIACNQSAQRFGAAARRGTSAAAPGFAFLHRRHSRSITSLFCARCENASRAQYAVCRGTEFVDCREEAPWFGWLCSLCAAIESAVRADDSLLNMECKTWEAPQPTAAAPAAAAAAKVRAMRAMLPDDHPLQRRFELRSDLCRLIPVECLQCEGAALTPTP